MSAVRPLLLPVLLAALLALAACAGPTGPRPLPIPEALPPAPADAAALVAGLQDLHRGPRTVTFTQDVIDHRPGVEPSRSSMDEWMSAPGHLRIDVLGDQPMTILFHPEGRTAVTAEGITQADQVNAAQVFMLDVFVEAPATWLERAAALGLDTSVLSQQAWDGVPHLVLGAEAGQDEVTQLWFDARTWLPVRFLERRVAGDGSVHMLEGRVFDYRLFGEVVFHTRFEFLMDGRPLLDETYRDIVIDPPLDPGLFDAELVRARRFGG